MTVERIIAALVCVGLIWALIGPVRRRGFPPFTDPLAIFLGVWAIALGLFALPVIEYSETRIWSWLWIYLSIATFTYGAMLALRRFGLKPGRDPVSSAAEPTARRVHLTWLLTGALSLVGFAFFVRAIGEVVDWTTIFSDPNAARTAQEAPGFDAAYGIGKPLSYLAPISVLAWTIALRQRMFFGIWRYVAALELIVLTPYVLSAERLSLLTAATLIIFFHIVWRPVQIPRRRLAVGAGVFAIAALTYFYAIGSQKESTLDSHPEVSAAVTRGALEPVAMPYLYWTANLPVFGQLTRDPVAPRTWGQMTALPVSKVFYKAAGSDAAPRFGAFYPIPFDSYNSATWLDAFYRDFGPVGAIMLPGLAGFAVTWLALRALRRRTVASAWVASIALGLIVFSPLKNQLVDAITWELVVFALPLELIMASDRPTRIRELRAAFDRRLPNWLGPGLALSMLALVAVGTAVLAFINRDGSEASGSMTRQQAAERLDQDSDNAGRLFDEVGPSTTAALISQLEVAEPGSSYEELPVPDAEPRNDAMVGVYADPSTRSFRLRVRTGEAAIVEAGRIDDKEFAVGFGPKGSGRRAFINSGFERPFELPWQSDGEGIQVVQRSPGHDSRTALLVSFARDRAKDNAAVWQRIDDLPSRDAGDVYRLTAFVRQHDLSQPVLLGLQFIYRTNRDADFYTATVGSKPASRQRDATGIPAGTSTTWQKLTAEGEVKAPLSAISVYAVYAGKSPVEGQVLIDSMKLTAVGAEETPVPGSR